MDKNFVGEQLSNSFVVEGHQSFKKDDISRGRVCTSFQSLMSHKGVLWNGYTFFSMFHFIEGFVGKVKVKCTWMIEVVSCHIDFFCVDALIKMRIYFCRNSLDSRFKP